MTTGDEGFDRRPTALVIGEDGDGTVARAIDMAGARHVGLVSLAEGVERLERQAAVDVVVLAPGDHDGPVLDALIGLIDGAVREGRYRATATISTILLDLAAFALTHASFNVLVEPTFAELSLDLAITIARSRVAARVQDRGDEADARQLLALSAEISRVADRLADMAGSPRRPRAAAPPDDPGFVPPPTAENLRALIRARRVRDQYFEPDMFADPAWDMMLDLAAANKEGRGVSVSSLCIAAGVPATTALRWIARMEEAGLMRRTADPRDRRRVFIALTDDTATRMDGCLRGMMTAVMPQWRAALAPSAESGHSA